MTYKRYISVDGDTFITWNTQFKLHLLFDSSGVWKEPFNTAKALLDSETCLAEVGKNHSIETCLCSEDYKDQLKQSLTLLEKYPCDAEHK